MNHREPSYLRLFFDAVATDCAAKSWLGFSLTRTRRSFPRRGGRDPVARVREPKSAPRRTRPGDRSSRARTGRHALAPPPVRARPHRSAPPGFRRAPRARARARRERPSSSALEHVRRDALSDTTPPPSPPRGARGGTRRAPRARTPPRRRERPRRRGRLLGRGHRADHGRLAPVPVRGRAAETPRGCGIPPRIPRGPVAPFSWLFSSQMCTLEQLPDFVAVPSPRSLPPLLPPAARLS